MTLLPGADPAEVEHLRPRESPAHRSRISSNSISLSEPSCLMSTRWKAFLSRTRLEARLPRFTPAVLAIDENMDETAFGQGLAVLTEQCDLISDARVAQLADPESGGDGFRKSDRSEETATGFGADPDRVAGMDVETAALDQPGVDRAVDAEAGLYVVDGPVVHRRLSSVY